MNIHTAMHLEAGEAVLCTDCCVRMSSLSCELPAPEGLQCRCVGLPEQQRWQR